MPTRRGTSSIASISCFRRLDGTPDPLFLATGAPGLIEAQRTVKSDDGRRPCGAGTAHSSILAPDPRAGTAWKRVFRGTCWVRGCGLRPSTARGLGRAGFIGRRRAAGRTHVHGDSRAERSARHVHRDPDTRAPPSVDLNSLKLGVAGSLTINKDEDLRAAGGWYRTLSWRATRPHWPVQSSAPGPIVPAKAWRRPSQGVGQRNGCVRGPSQASLLSAAAPNRGSRTDTGRGGPSNSRAISSWSCATGRSLICST